LETVLRRYWDAVANGAPHPKEKNLGVYLRELENKDVGEKKVRAVLAQIKDLHRNPLFHPEDQLSIDDAVGLFGIVRSAVTAMLKEIPDPQSSNPIAFLLEYTTTPTT